MPFTFPCLKRHFHVERASSQEVPQPGLHLYFHSGHERGVLLENVDETQLLLLSLLDGHHSFEALVAQLQAQHAAVTAEEVAEILDDLASYGLLEDAAIAPPADLTATDLGRYASQIRFFSIFDTTGKHAYEMQAQLKRARVTVLGLGGL